MTPRHPVDAVFTLADGAVQLDLFGATEVELARRAEQDRRRELFEARARFDDDGAPVVWIAPYDCPTARRGEQLAGWRCWLCGGVEVNAYVLGLNHGLTAEDPDVLDRATCTRRDRHASKAGSSSRASDTDSSGDTGGAGDSTTDDDTWMPARVGGSRGGRL